MTPLEQYRIYLQSKKFEEDSQQQAVIGTLNEIYLELLPRFSKMYFIKRKLGFRAQPVTGLYLWGSVGIGKTWMMDLFYNTLPRQYKLRMHFHAFMQSIHQQLKHYRDKKDPLKIIAKNLANENIVICFDEFFVSDIADAMLLAGLFTELFKQGVTLIATSNVAPDNLYKGGISRDQFLPAIDLIKRYTKVVHIPAKKDYRLRNLDDAGTFLQPLTEKNRQLMRTYFTQLSHEHYENNAIIMIAKRPIQTVRKAAGVVWFLFEEICNVPRSQIDYLEIAKSYHTVFVSNVPKLAEHQTKEAIYLINLVDVFYDASVNLIISAACPLEELYQSGLMAFEFERTKSRLIEMQSKEYWGQAHHLD